MRYWLALLALAPLAWARAGQVTEIVYEDADPGAPAYTSRLLVQGERLRIDYGRDADDFVLYDRRAGMVYQVSHGAARITGIPAQPVRRALPKGWRLDVARAAGTTQITLDGRQCVEYRSAPLLPEAARLMRDFRRALAGAQAAAWEATPEDLRDPCVLALEVVEAGAEYAAGLPLVIRYADGRSRVYRSHGPREVRRELFELPPGYARFTLQADGSP